MKRSNYKQAQLRALAGSSWLKPFYVTSLERRILLEFATLILAGGSMHFDRRNLGVVGAATVALGGVAALELPKYGRLDALANYSGVVTHIRDEDRSVPLALGGRLGGFPVTASHRVFSFPDGTEVAVRPSNVEGMIQVGDVVIFSVNSSNRLAEPVVSVSKQ